MDKLHKIAEELNRLTTEEASDILVILKEDYGIEAPETIIPAILIEDSIQEQTEFDVVLISVSPLNTIKIVRLIKELTGLGLVESRKKMMSASLPTILFEKVDKKRANEIADQFRDLGCMVETK